MRAQLAEPGRDPTSGAGRRPALPPSRLLPVALLTAAGLAMTAGAQPAHAQRVDSESQPADRTSAPRFAPSGTVGDGDLLLFGNNLFRSDDALSRSSHTSGNVFSLGVGAGTDQSRTGTRRTETTTAEPGRDVFGWLGDQVAPETKAALADPNKLLTDQSKAFIVLDTPPAIWANAVRLGSLPQALPIGVRDAFSTVVCQTLFNRPILKDKNADTAAKLLANTVNQYGTEAIFGGVQNHLRTTRATDGTPFYPQWLRQQKFQSGLAGWNSLIGVEIVAANGLKPYLAEPLGLPTPTGRNADGQPQFATDADWWKNEAYDVAAFNVPITTTLIPKMLGDSATNAAVAAAQLRAAGAADTLVGGKIALDYAAKVDAPTPQQVLKRAAGIFLIIGGNKLGSDLLSNSPPALKPYLGEISRNLDELNNVDPSLMASGFNSYVSIPFNIVKGFWSFADGVTSLPARAGRGEPVRLLCQGWAPADRPGVDRERTGPELRPGRVSGDPDTRRPRLVLPRRRRRRDGDGVLLAAADRGDRLEDLPRVGSASPSSARRRSASGSSESASTGAARTTASSTAPRGSRRSYRRTRLVPSPPTRRPSSTT